jgi:lipopolysaccharide transport system ATP-binding protein
MTIIEVDHVTKEFSLGAMQGLKQGLINTATRLTGKPVAERPLFKALDDVSFRIERGEVVGIIGHNGAGKSTLLKLLAGISKPTSGSIRVDGRVAPLIEVGAGFVPDFTGRENVYLNGAIMGMSKEYIERKFDEIVDFAEMAEFIDTPVKRYSSGMKVKLAFSVATSIDAEILIVDEVLAVGDLAFQQKCIERMENLIKQEGRTVLIVGHNIRQLQRICERIILLDHGRITQDGSPSEVCNTYYNEAQKRNIERHKRIDGEIAPQRSADIISVKTIEVLNENDVAVPEVKMNGTMKVRVVFTTKKLLEQPDIVIGLHTSDFVQVLAVSNAQSDVRPDFAPGTHQIACSLDNIPLRPANYAVRLAILDRYKQTLWSAENLSSITITPGEFDINKLPISGFVNIPSVWGYCTTNGQTA